MNNDGERAYTVLGLKLALAELPENAKVRIYDADTGWTIPRFTVSYDEKDNELWLFPCAYSDMEN